MSWRREDHYAKALPEQDVRQVARAQRHNAGCYARAEVIALAYAGEALEPTRKSWWARLIRWWRR